MPRLLQEKRVALLLDGLNEIPTGQNKAKYREVQQFTAAHPDLLLVVSCRERDYTVDLQLDRVEVAPLDAVRVRQFVVNYLGEAHGEALFWKLAGEKAQTQYEHFTAAVGEKLERPFATFWLTKNLPEGIQWGIDLKGYKNHYWESWLTARTQPASLLVLAYNPYMLSMLAQVYINHRGTLPTNRGALFKGFVDALLEREKLSETADTAAQLLHALTELAYAMQEQRQVQEDGNALTVLPLEQAARYLNEAQQQDAHRANLLIVTEQEVRFAHQLLQEYFVAHAMDVRIFPTDDAQPLDPTTIWPSNNWWEPTNWEEAVILLAGLYSDDCSAVVLWLADAQPELAARCIVESGAKVPEETLLRLRNKWVPRLTDLSSDPEAKARAAIGRALGRIRLADGRLLDNREGVGIIIKNGQKLPDIVWGEMVEADSYTIGGDTDAYGSFEKKDVTISEPFALSRYPVTYAQFQCFVEAPDFDDERWWEGMPEEQRGRQLKEIAEQSYSYWNHPREMVTWYQAVAFCRWLSDKLGVEVTLPHEHEWEVAARHPDGRKYSYGDEFDSQKGNTDDSGIGLTTAVGLYPHGRNEHLNLYDMTGNVWEWCQNKQANPEEDTVDDSGAARVLRGSSFDDDRNSARAAYRFDARPMSRHDGSGFQVCVRRSPSV